MKVLYFHQHFTTPEGFGGTRSYEMARRLIQRGHSVTMVCGNYGRGKTGLSGPFTRGRRDGEVDGIRIIEYELPYENRDGLLKRTWTFLRFAGRSVMRVFQEDCDIIFATTTPLTTGIPAIVGSWIRRKPMVFEVRDLWPELPKKMGVIKNPLILWAMSVLEFCSYRAATRCIGLSPGIVEGIKKRGVAESRITMIPNGCDLEFFDSDNVTAWRPDGIKDRDLLAVFTGAHGMANGLDALLDAAGVLQDRKCDDIKLLLIGDGKLKPKLMARANTEGLSNVVFHDVVQKQKLAGLLAGSDVGIQSLANVPAFYYGTSPNKFFDYLSAGIPVLINYPGWLATLIDENDCGIAVSPENPEAFADALEAFAADPEYRSKMGLAARKLAERQFNRELLSNQFVDWLELACGK